MNLDSIGLLQGLGAGLLVLGGALVAGAFLLAPARQRFRVERLRVLCPERNAAATVHFLVRQVNGSQVLEDVVRCSLEPGAVRVGCGKECRAAERARGS